MNQEAEPKNKHKEEQGKSDSDGNKLDYSLKNHLK